MTRYFYFCVFIALLSLQPVDARAQAAPNAIPRQLTLTQAETLLVQRNFAVLSARYQVEASRAARLIASYKPNPGVTLGMEQIPIYSPIKGSYPRFWTTNPDAGANPVYTFRL